MNLQRVGAIFEKDLKDFMKNMMLLMMPIIPLVLSLLYSRLSGEQGASLFMSYIIIGTTFATVTSACIMTMMAEENEKKTLRGLIQSPASMLDILLGKSLVTGLMTWITLILSLIIYDISPFLNVQAVIGLILLFLFFLFLGIGVGLFTKSVAATSPYLMPIMFLFGFTPMIHMLGLDPDSLAIQIADAFPLPQLIEMHHSSSWLSLGVVAIWMLGAAGFAWFCFKKTRTDD